MHKSKKKKYSVRKETFKNITHKLTGARAPPEHIKRLSDTTKQKTKKIYIYNMIIQMK
ncbi:hypothetical protein PGB90_009553 [Kerria lacca]